MIAEIHDNKLLRLLKQKIAKKASDVNLMRSTLYCGSQVVKFGIGTEPAVFVLANNEDAKFFGTTSCKNAWICPTCSARLMAKYANEIACAIDAIKEYENQVACMITFTIPHTSGMKCQEITDILFNTWKAFNIRGNKNLKSSWYAKEQKYARQAKKIRKFSGNKGSDVFASFAEQFNCHHRIRVGEFTWGENGWHPHFHCLFFVDKNKLQDVLKWQTKLNERWYELAKRQTIKYWNKIYPDNVENNKTRAEIMYTRMSKNESKGCYISVDKQGKVIEQKSSMYICGWGADKELTGNYQDKATNEGHMTPHQMLEKTQETGDEKWLDLYMEFARTIKTKSRRRISFGNSGIKAMIKKWQLTNEYKEVLQKKSTELVRNGKGFWKVVCWFTEPQWLQICFLDKEIPIKQMILEAALETDGRKIIKDTLEEYDIFLRDREPINAEFALIEKFVNPSMTVYNYDEETA